MKKKVSGGKGKGKKAALSSPRRKVPKASRRSRGASPEFRAVPNSSSGEGSNSPVDAASEREISQSAELVAAKPDSSSLNADEPEPLRQDLRSGSVQAVQSPDLEIKTETATALSVDLEDTEEVLSFYLGDEEYAVDLMNIREIMAPVAITSVPKTPPFIKGIISLRGIIIPVFDLRVRLGLSDAASTGQERFLVFSLEKGLMAVVADRVTEVMRIRKDDVEPPPSTIRESSEHLKGVTRFNGRLIIFLDVEKAISHSGV